MSHGELIAVRSHRIRLVLQGAGWLMVAIGTPWAVAFTLQGLWVLAALDVVVAVAGGIVVFSVRHDHLRLGAAVFVGSAYAVTCALGLFIDVPDGTHPRSMHVFLLALAFAAHLVLQLERRLLYYGVPVVCMLTYLVLASSTVGYPLPYGIPEEHRALSAWFNNFSALLCLFTVMVLMHADIRVRTALEADLHAGLKNHQLIVYYQPQVAHDGQVMGAETLVRWKHPVRGLVPPSEFIPLAEQCGLISELGQVVLETACQQLVAWAKRPDRAQLTLSVNVSASELHEPAFIHNILAVLARTGANPARLKVELTETMLVNNIDDVMAKMAALREKGIGVSLDDFGTGYSSLNYLKRLPLDQIKIDKSFVDNVQSDSSDAAIARTVVALGQELGLHVIAEGVETEEQRQLLESIGCMAYQGYLYSRPLPVAAFEQFLRDHEAARQEGRPVPTL